MTEKEADEQDSHWLCTLKKHSKRKRNETKYAKREEEKEEGG